MPSAEAVPWRRRSTEAKPRAPQEQKAFLVVECMKPVYIYILGVYTLDGGFLGRRCGVGCGVLKRFFAFQAQNDSFSVMLNLFQHLRGME